MIGNFSFVENAIWSSLETDKIFQQANMITLLEFHDMVRVNIVDWMMHSCSKILVNLVLAETWKSVGNESVTSVDKIRVKE